MDDIIDIWHNECTRKRRSGLSMTSENKLLDKLIKRQEKLAQEIKQAKAVQAKKEAAIQANKCRIIGAAILAEIKYNETFKTTIDPIIHKHTTSSKDRKILGLAPLVKSNNDASKIEKDKTQ
jgi:hypothetical protein